MNYFPGLEGSFAGQLLAGDKDLKIRSVPWKERGQDSGFGENPQPGSCVLG